RGTIIEAGLENPVGVGGGRLTAQQRQKVALARALLKDPDLLILNEATGSLDNAEQARITEQVISARGEKGLIWAPENPDLARLFDEVLLVKDGRVAGRGEYESLAEQHGPL
ncbi:MAG: ABC transporter ATP-binding protein, partial [Pseudomonadota bacterium]